MPASKAWKDRIRDRASVVSEARRLARSGEHQDHASIIVALQANGAADAAAQWFSDRLFLLQLDWLCQIARERAARVPPVVMEKRQLVARAVA